MPMLIIKLNADNPEELLANPEEVGNEFYDIKINFLLFN